MPKHTTVWTTLLLMILAETSVTQHVLVLIITVVFGMRAGTIGNAQHTLSAALASWLQAVTSVFFLTSSLLTFYVMFELRLVPVLLLVGLQGYQPEKIQASTFLIVYTVIGSAPLLYYTVGNMGCVSFADTCGSRTLSTLLCLTFLVKSPMYTVHAWLPKAHVEAPLVGSILLAGVLLKLGGYGLMVLAPNLGAGTQVYVYLTLLGGVSCRLLCLRAWDLKALVAYSSIVHMGTVTLRALSGTELGY